MSKIHSCRSKVRWLLTVFVFCGCFAQQAQAAWIGSEGDEWLKWDSNARAVYVRAYVQGLQQGYTQGCEAGINAGRPRLKSDDVVEFHKECWSHFPISTRDSMQIVDSVTKFYLAYPKERYIYISDILLGLHAGLTLEQIHDSPMSARNK